MLPYTNPTLTESPGFSKKSHKVYAYVNLKKNDRGPLITALCVS